MRWLCVFLAMQTLDVSFARPEYPRAPSASPRTENHGSSNQTLADSPATTRSQSDEYTPLSPLTFSLIKEDTTSPTTLTIPALIEEHTNTSINPARGVLTLHTEADEELTASITDTILGKVILKDPLGKKSNAFTTHTTGELIEETTDTSVIVESEELPASLITPTTIAPNKESTTSPIDLTTLSIDNESTTSAISSTTVALGNESTLTPNSTTVALNNGSTTSPISLTTLMLDRESNTSLPSPNHSRNNDYTKLRVKRHLRKCAICDRCDICNDNYQCCCLNHGMIVYCISPDL